MILSCTMINKITFTLSYLFLFVIVMNNNMVKEEYVNSVKIKMKQPKNDLRS